jgi:SAM-dependent methyltransferase
MCDQACIEFGIKYLTPNEIQGKKVIEVGAYDVNGSLRPHIMKNNPSKYIGIDIAPGPGVDEICDANDIIQKYGASSFDILISTEMIEHIENWKKILSNFKNIVGEGGIIILTTRSKGFGLHNYPVDFWRYEDSDLRNIFEDFIVEKTEKDIYAPGIFMKAIKPKNFQEKDISQVKLYNILHDKIE